MDLDNSMNHSQTEGEHIVHVWEGITLPKEIHRTARCANCASACPEVDFRSIDIDMDCFHTQEHKTHAVIDWPQTDQSKDVRGFLGLTSYYQRFIRHYTHIAMLFHMIGTTPSGEGDFGQWRGDPMRVRCNPFAWETECLHEFDTCEDALCNAAVLALPDPEA